MKPPKDVRLLFCDLENPSDFTQNPWAQPFREHLRSKQMEHILNFVIQAEILEKLVTARVITSHSDQLVELLKSIYEEHFMENCVEPVILSNRLLKKEIVESLSEISGNSDQMQLQEAAKLVTDAKSDMKIWQLGIDKAYKDFLATKPSLPLNAVLLTLL